MSVLNDQIALFLQNMSLINTMTHGDVDEDIETEGGTIPTLAKMANQMVSNIISSLTAYSVSSVSLALGSKNFQIGTGKHFSPGQWVTCVSGEITIIGTVENYIGPTLTVLAQRVIGTAPGNVASWSITFAGIPGVDAKADTEQSLTIAASPTVTTLNFATAKNYHVVLTADGELANPQNMNNGDKMRLTVVQGNGGGHVLRYSSGFAFLDGILPTLSIDEGAVDVIEITKSNGDYYFDLRKNYVAGVTADITAPTSVTLTATTTNLTIDDNIGFTATGTDNVALVKATFYRDGVEVSVDPGSGPFGHNESFTSADNGTINYTVVLEDAAGNTTTSDPLVITINIPVIDNTNPTIALTSSSINVTEDGNITLTATVTDDVAVDYVEFYRDGVLLSTDNSSPFTCVEDFTDYDNGTIAYTAKVFDTSGNNVTSNTVNITVAVTVHVQPLTQLDVVTQAAYDTAINNAFVGNKRLAAANAIVNILSPDHRLYIYQNGTLIVPIHFTGECTVVDDGEDIYVQPSVTIDSSDPLVSADLTVGTWWYELQGGTDYQRVLMGSVGNSQSNADLQLAENPAPGQGILAAIKFVMPRSLDEV